MIIQIPQNINTTIVCMSTLKPDFNGLYHSIITSYYTVHVVNIIIADELIFYITRSFELCLQFASQLFEITYASHPLCFMSLNETVCCCLYTQSTNRSINSIPQPMFQIEH